MADDASPVDTYLFTDCHGQIYIRLTGVDTGMPIWQKVSMIRGVFVYDRRPVEHVPTGRGIAIEGHDHVVMEMRHEQVGDRPEWTTMVDIVGKNQTWAVNETLDEVLSLIRGVVPATLASPPEVAWDDGGEG